MSATLTDLRDLANRACDSIVIDEPEPMTDDQQTIACLCALISALQNEVHSSDKWWLAHHSARRMTRELGVPEEAYDSVIQKLEEARAARKTRNPMAGMFA